MKEKRRIKDDFSLMAVLLIPVCIAINTAGYQTAALLKLPLYLDCIGTVLSGMLAGPWVGAITGLASNCVFGIFNPTDLPFAIVNMCFGIAAGILSGKGMFTKWWKIVISGVVLTFVAVLIATPISVLFFGGATGSGNSIITAILVATGKGLWTSCFTASALTEFGDKELTVFICYFIARNMSARYLSKLRNGHMFIRNKETPVIE